MGQDVTTLAVAFNSSSYDTALLWTGATGRYQAIHESELDSNDHRWRVADSVSVDLNNGAASFILFADFEDVPAGSPDDYASFKGAFCQLTNAAPGTSFEVDLGPLDWKDRAASMMLVNTQRGPETRKSVRDTFLETWN